MWERLKNAFDDALDMEILALGSRKGLSEDKLKELFDRQTHYVIQRLVGAML